MAGMRTRRLLASMGSLLALASGCRATPATAGCDAGAVAFAIGRTYDEALAKAAVRASGARVVRSIRPKEVVTMEFQADRLTVSLDDRDRIVRLSCG